MHTTILNVCICISSQYLMQRRETEMDGILQTEQLTGWSIACRSREGGHPSRGNQRVQPPAPMPTINQAARPCDHESCDINHVTEFGWNALSIRRGALTNHAGRTPPPPLFFFFFFFFCDKRQMDDDQNCMNNVYGSTYMYVWEILRASLFWQNKKLSEIFYPDPD